MICVVFDVETTGLNKNVDRIIQFSGIKVDLVTNIIVDEIDLYIKPDSEYTMSIGAYFKHKISREFLENKKTFKEQLNDILNFLGDDNISLMTYNGLSFDIIMLKAELKRCGIDIDFSKRKCFDILREEKRRNGNTLQQTYERYFGHPMNESNLTAHNALSDVKATFDIYKEQCKTKQVEPEKVYGDDNFIVDMEFNNKIFPCFSVGKYKGLPVLLIKKIDLQYIEWCLSDSSGFSKSTKNAISLIINI